MSILKKLVQISATAAFIILFNFLHRLNADDKSRSRSKAGATGKHDEVSLDSSTWSFYRNRLNPRLRGQIDPTTNALSSHFRSGTPKPPGSTYSHVMVVPRLKVDDISWIQEELPGFDTAVYVANDPIAPLHPPRNKGHEVMVYLTYIIDHYGALPDIMVFMHAHRWTHHNIELLGHDSAEMVRRLSSDYVTKEGYVNMRCQWSPGCPEWLHPNDEQETLAKQEQVVLSKCWRELFPQEPLPDTLGQACCAQFALSKERIQSIPLSRFVFYRDWILRTPLSDYVSGRIWEYLWQFLFTGRTIYCPSEHECHCRGFGVCFGGEAEYKEFEELRRTKQDYELEQKELRERRAVLEDDKGAADKGNRSSTNLLDSGRYSYLHDRVEALGQEINARRQKAVERGTKSENRDRSGWQ